MVETKVESKNTKNKKVGIERERMTRRNSLQEQIVKTEQLIEFKERELDGLDLKLAKLKKARIKQIELIKEQREKWNID